MEMFLSLVVHSFTLLYLLTAGSNEKQDWPSWNKSLIMLIFASNSLSLFALVNSSPTSLKANRQPSPDFSIEGSISLMHASFLELFYGLQIYPMPYFFDSLAVSFAESLWSYYMWEHKYRYFIGWYEAGCGRGTQQIISSFIRISIYKLVFNNKPEFFTYSLSW